MEYLNSELYLMFINMKKDDINFYRKTLDCDVRSNLNKADMAAGVALYIEHESEYWLRKIPTWELAVVEKLVELEPGEEFDAGFQPMPSILESLRLVKVRVDENDHVLYSVTKFMHRVFKSGLKSALAYVYCQNYPWLDRYAMGMLNLYGMLEKTQFDRMLTIAGRAIEEEDGGDVHGIYGYMYSMESLLVNYNKLVAIGGKEFVFHPCIENPARMFEEIQGRPVPEQYKKFTYNQAREAGMGYPFISTAQDTPEGKEVVKILNQLTRSEKSTEVIYNELYVLCQESPDALMTFVTAIADGKLDSIDQVQKLVQTFTAFSNAIPRWELKGYSSNEVFEKYEKPKLKPLPSQPFNPMNFAPKNIGRNDPCPCGSGKKYKNCHGKLS